MESDHKPTEAEEAAKEDTARQDMINRFNDLQQEAKSIGLISMVILLDVDPIADTEGAFISYTGCGFIIAMGMLEFGIRYLRCKEVDANGW